MSADATTSSPSPTTQSTTPTDASPSSTNRPPPPLCPLLQDGEDYDAWVLAGGRLFRAHGSVLASHSAYLKACVGSDGGDTRVLLPHVPSAGFAAVLAYMYTGRLPLNPATLYEVLVTGHLLQMPSVVSLCQALLTTTTASTAAIAASATSLDIPEVPPALSMWRGLARLVPPHVASTSTSTLPATIIRPTPTRARPTHLHIDPPQADNRDEIMDSSTSGIDDPNPCQKAESTSNAASYSLDDDKTISERVHPGAVIIDIAACDGPVFFERVINRAYKANPLAGNEDSETDTEINVEELDSCDDSMGAMSENTQPRKEGIMDKCSLANSLRLAAAGLLKGNVTSSSPPTPNNHMGRTYHCVYCNHTFKSHYCYQKHMRRHINPITVEIDKLRGSSAPSTCNAEVVQEQVRQDGKECWGESSRGSVGGSSATQKARSRSTSPCSAKSVSPTPSGGLKILDLNVQYFPCKTCGSKFPSYYFVHKHRRLCHQEEPTSSTSEKSSRQSTPKSLPATPTPTSATTSTI